MGEYMEHHGQRIKVGTCEDLYYLRADQLHLVTACGDADPMHQPGYRFRFPWPSEDDIAPGAFEDYDRGQALHGLASPDGVEHGIVQFVARQGYNVCLPCPEGPEPSHGLRVHRNGFPGSVRIVQQRPIDGALALICACQGCGHRWNYPTLSDAEPVILACRSEADRRMSDAGELTPTSHYWHQIADRIVAGYTDPPAWVAQFASVTS